MGRPLRCHETEGGSISRLLCPRLRVNIWVLFSGVLCISLWKGPLFCRKGWPTGKAMEVFQCTIELVLVLYGNLPMEEYARSMYMMHVFSEFTISQNEGSPLVSKWYAVSERLKNMNSATFETQNKIMNVTIGSRPRRRAVVRVQVWVVWIRSLCRARISGRLGRVGSDFGTTKQRPTLPPWL